MHITSRLNYLAIEVFATGGGGGGGGGGLYWMERKRAGFPKLKFVTSMADGELLWRS